MMHSEVVRDLLPINQNRCSAFVDLLKTPRNAFFMASGGMIRFSELLEWYKRVVLGSESSGSIL